MYVFAMAWAAASLTHLQQSVVCGVVFECLWCKQLLMAWELATQRLA
jgi:hypothetical protein